MGIIGSIFANATLFVASHSRVSRRRDQLYRLRAPCMSWAYSAAGGSSARLCAVPVPHTDIRGCPDPHFLLLSTEKHEDQLTAMFSHPSDIM